MSLLLLSFRLLSIFFQRQVSLLTDLMKIDQMRQSNVNFLSSLDYLALQRQK